MSTRSYIKFIDGKNIITIYKHWDGYPSSTIQELEDFFKWDGVNSRGSYTVANFITFHKVKGALHYEKNQVNEDKEYSIKNELENPEHNSHLHLGFGIEGDLSVEAICKSWAEWYYIVNFDTMTINIYAVGKDELISCGSSKIITKENNFGDNTEFVRLDHDKKLVKEIEND